MKTQLTFLLLLFNFLSAVASPPTHTTLPKNKYIAAMAVDFISTHSNKEIELVLHRKLKLKEKIVFKLLRLQNKAEGIKTKKGKAAMILGIVAVAGFVIPYVAIISIPAAILAIVFGSQAKKENPTDNQARAGFILGIVALGLIVLALLVILAFLASGGFII